MGDIKKEMRMLVMDLDNYCLSLCKLEGKEVGSTPIIIPINMCSIRSYAVQQYLAKEFNFL